MANKVYDLESARRNLNRPSGPQMPNIEIKKPTTPDNKKNIKKPHSNRGKKFVATTLATLTVAGAIVATNSAKENEDVILPTSVQDFYNNPHEDDYTADTEILESFLSFEQALADYNKYSEKSGLSVVEKKALENAVQTLSENYSSFEKIYMFQAKAKIAQAFGISRDKVGSIKLERLSNYKKYTIKYHESTIADNIPKEMERAIDDIIALQNYQGLNYDFINEKYNNMLKFLVVDFEKNEDGDLVKSDEEYQATSESVLAHYKPIYENLIEKKDSQDGKLKKSQQKRLKDVTHKMYGPLLEHVQENLFKLASISPEDFKNYSKIIEEISGQHADGKADFEAIFPIIYNMSIDIDAIIANHDLTATFGESEPEFGDER